MEWVRGHLVEVKKRDSDNEWEWAIITGPQVAHSFGKMMYPFWNRSGYSHEFTDRFKDFSGSDLDRNIYLDQWDAEQQRLQGRGGSRKKSRRRHRNKRKTNRRLPKQN